MATICDEQLEQVKYLYNKEGFGMREIANKMSVSIDAISYFMRKHDLKRRSPQDSNSLRYQKAATSFHLRELKTEKLRTLKAVGTMLYWGEGCKSDKVGVVDFANCDSVMIITFMKFLREVCGVNENRLRMYLYLHTNQNIESCIKYWSGITGVSKNQFTKPYIRKDFNESKKDKMPHGLIHVRYSDKKLLNLIKKWIKEYSE